MIHALAEPRPVSPTPLTMEGAIRTLFGAQYHVLRHIHRGPVADVWQVRDRQSGEIRGWKQLRAEWEDDPTVRRMFENEADIGRRISSPRVVRILDFQIDLRPRVLILEWFVGETLEARLARPPALSLASVLWTARQAAEGLRDLWDAGYVHGDVKPGNLLLAESGQTALIDLGFARPVPEGTHNVPSARILTGTPEFLAPETLQPLQPDCGFKDQYSFGVMLYRMLTGRLPFSAETSHAVVRLQREGKPDPLRKHAPHVRREIAAFVEQLLAKQPLRRGLRWPEIVDALIGFELEELPVLLAGLRGGPPSRCRVENPGAALSAHELEYQ